MNKERPFLPKPVDKEKRGERRELTKEQDNIANDIATSVRLLFESHLNDTDLSGTSIALEEINGKIKRELKKIARERKK